jgi:5-methylcytosine-specific restriction endonuclease McrA
LSKKYAGKGHYNWQGGNKYYTCKQCKKVFQAKHRQKYDFCSRECFSKYNVGKNHSRYKGGIKYDKQNKQYREWRKQVFERDNWTCQICKRKKKIRIVAHHIKSFTDYPESRFEINNGITLCNSCHTQIHNILRTLTGHTSNTSSEDMVGTAMKIAEMSKTRNDSSTTH